jgi:hypothetical protein
MVSAGVSVGFFDIFTASVDIDVNTEDKVEYTESTEFDPSKSCTSSQEALTIFIPHFNYYAVMDRNNQQHDIWIPLAGGQLGRQCLG